MRYQSIALFVAVGVAAAAGAKTVQTGGGIFAMQVATLPIPRCRLGVRHPGVRYPAAWNARILFYRLRPRAQAMLWLDIPRRAAIAGPIGNGGFLIAFRASKSGGAKSGTTIAEFNPLSLTTTVSRHYPWMMPMAVFGSPQQIGFEAGPGPTVWCITHGSGRGRSSIKVRAINWTTGKVTGAFVPARGFGIGCIFPVRGAAVLVDNQARPVIYVASTDGKCRRAKLPRGFHAVPYYMRAFGRTLSGVSEDGAEFVSLRVAKGDRLRHVFEHPLAGGKPIGILDYRYVDRSLGVALAWGKSPEHRRLYFVRTGDGTVIKRQIVDFPGAFLATFHRRVYLISGAGGRVAEVGSDGRIIRECGPPSWFHGLAGPSSAEGAGTLGK